MSLNIELYDPATGVTVPQSFVDIATIRFTIEDDTKDPALTWRTASPNPLTVFSDDEATMVDSNTLTAEVLLADLKVFLQGPYSSGSMSTALNTGGHIPLSQPFDTAPWNYAGTESVEAIPAGVVDWVFLQLRSDETTVVDSRAGFITSDGMVVDLNGASPVTFNVIDNSYYVVVYHRNHLAIMNASTMNLNKAAAEDAYDFTDAQSKAYGTNPMKDLGSGAFGLFTGDANSDGQVTSSDFNIFNPAAQSAQTGYQASDWNLDGQVTSSDFNQFNPNAQNAAQSQVPAIVTEGSKERPEVYSSDRKQSVGQQNRTHINTSRVLQQAVPQRNAKNKEKSNER
jgi:hypothetical protein